jgi:hypothetical protein
MLDGYPLVLACRPTPGPRERPPTVVEVDHAGILGLRPEAARRDVPVRSLVYGWFTEGFETRDLKEAKALLEELAA